MPWLAPVSWIFQTLAVFFLVGYSAARGYRGGYLPWLRKRMIRLARPVAALAAVWVPVTVGLLLVAVTDLARFGLHGPGWVGWVNVAAGWLVPYLLGIAWARGWLAQGSLRGRRVPALMLAAATAALIAWAGYPASMVGVNGARISNLNPPTLAVMSFAVAQCGLALLLRDRLARLMRRPLAWAGIALVNLSAMTLFLWHQTAFITVSSVGLLVGRVPGLLTAPDGGLWVAERLAWLPVFAITLSVLWLAFRRVERG